MRQQNAFENKFTAKCIELQPAKRTNEIAQVRVCVEFTVRFVVTVLSAKHAANSKYNYFRCCCWQRRCRLRLCLCWRNAYETRRDRNCGACNAEYAPREQRENKKTGETCCCCCCCGLRIWCATDNRITGFAIQTAAFAALKHCYCIYGSAK